MLVRVSRGLTRAREASYREGMEFVILLAGFLVLLILVVERTGILMAGIDDILVKLAAETTVVASVALGVDEAITKLAELRAIIAAGATDPAKIQQALDQIDADTALLTSKKDALGAAVAANT